MAEREDTDGKPLLIEIGTEELPIHAVDELARAFADGILRGLESRRVDIGQRAGDREPRAYSTPRRLAAYLPWVATAQPTQQVEVLGPTVNVGLDANGQPTPALQGFAAKNGVDANRLERIATDKGERFAYRSVKPGQPTAALLPEIVAEALKALPIPKPMRWGAHDFAFVRPAHWLVMLHGDRVVEGEVLGLKADRMSRGHRFHAPRPLWITDADAWLQALRDVKVLADPLERRERVRAEVARVAAELDGTPRLSDALVEEIANLTEWPVAVGCAFEREFLAVPQEALVMTMETNQKFVPLFDAAGKLSERFIGVANIDSKEPVQIRRGYERVIRPRFADAKFFFDEDLKAPLDGYRQALQAVTYQQALGSVWDKCMRVAELARGIANRLRERGVALDTAQAVRAAELSKCDLLTRMVGEFPELQGVMGRYYATAHGEPGEVAQALDEFYMPRQSGDGIASGAVGRALAVAERLDTLAGIFAVGLKPSGNKDPFALRRAALGLARTLIEGGLELDLRAQLAEALDLIPEAAFAAGLKPGKDGKAPALDVGARRQALAADIYAFVRDRLRGYYLEQGFSAEQFEAVAARDDAPFALPSLLDFDRRLRAVAEFGRLPEAASLAAANKRVANILRKELQDTPGAAPPAVAAELLREPAEQALWSALEAARGDTRAIVHERRDYAAALARLAALQAPIDRFFDDVMVVAEDLALRANRLALLAHIRALFNAVADIARL
ncbi:MAG: glycine--tRNA ligase subunit beta [Mizugakiibacter sp.]|uniref:glycine--tRNA ligase subunit beta n=1 Tax=Mizugakiibacter sp. TaxID=1972610 RepID=UPI0031C1660E|nr:glycine--tRNA ligase subunit beta [Xanthomonadaceae bacterium]